MIIWKQHLVDHIGELAQKRGKTLKDICLQADLQPNTISKLRSHKRRHVDIDEAERLAQALGFRDLITFLREIKK